MGITTENTRINTNDGVPLAKAEKKLIWCTEMLDHYIQINPIMGVQINLFDHYIQINPIMGVQINLMGVQINLWSKLIPSWVSQLIILPINHAN